jgi:hypothetical protein
VSDGLNQDKTIGQLRAEVREWLRAHRPAQPLPSVDQQALLQAA